MSSKEKILSMKNVVKKYQMGDEEQTVLKNISLDVFKGEHICVLGKSGAGKSTLMNILGCLDIPSSGQYFLANKDVSCLSEEELSTVRNKEIGFVFQSFYLLKRLTALENVELPLIYAGIPEKERKSIARQMLKKVGLSDRENHLPNQLSGGQQQRVAIARALSNNPSILLCDEPTGALDSTNSAQVLEILESLHNEGATIIMITHDESLASVADRVIRIHDGKISEDGDINYV